MTSLLSEDLSHAPNRIRPDSLRVTNASEHYAATVHAEFRDVAPAFEVPWLVALLNLLPKSLCALQQPNRTERLKYLARITRPHDWRADAGVEMQSDGRVSVEEFFTHVPLLSEQEVNDRYHITDQSALAQLMKVSWEDTTLYFADQFEENGTVNEVCVKSVAILRQEMNQWEIALWWISGNSWLDGPSPREVFRQYPDDVIEAATQEVEEDGY